MAEAFTLYKLIILYMLDKVDFPLTNSQISEFVLDKGYTDYFKLQQALSELADGGLILKESTHNRTLFHLTEDGKGTIHLFRDKISKPIQDDIDHFLQTKQYDLKNEVSVKADYMKNAGEEIFFFGVYIYRALDKLEADIIKDMKNSSFQSVENLYKFAK